MAGAKIKVAVVGCGEHAVENLIPALWLNSSCEIVALCDPDRGRAQALSERFPRAEIYASLQEMLAAVNMDAVVAAAPPQVHVEVANLALERGIHVFVEKPPSVNVEDLEKLAGLAKQKQLVTMIGHNLRYSTASLALKSISKEPGFGPPHSMEVRYFASKPRGDRWNLGSPLRSFLLSHVNHAVDFIAYHVGCPKEVSASATFSEDGTITLASQFVLPTGGVGTLFASTRMPHFSVHATVSGESGGYSDMQSLDQVVAYGLLDDKKRNGRIWTEQQLSTGYHHAGYQTELDLFIQAVQRGGKAEPSFEDEIKVYRVIDSIERQVSGSMSAISTAKETTMS